MTLRSYKKLVNCFQDTRRIIDIISEDWILDLHMCEKSVQL